LIIIANMSFIVNTFLHNFFIIFFKPKNPLFYWVLSTFSLCRTTLFF